MKDIVIGELNTSNLHIQNNGNKYVFNFGQIPLGFKLRLAQTVSIWQTMCLSSSL